MPAEVIEKQVKHSVQDQEPEATPVWGMVAFPWQNEEEFLPAWGTYAREYRLRELFLAAHNTLVTGALANLTRRIKQTPWELVGGRNKTYHFQEIFQEAQFGQGWDAFLSRLLQDFLVQDNGAWVEIIASGEADQPLTGRDRIFGIAALDSCRCYATGNTEHPVYYRSHRTNKLHKLHHTRVYRLVDMPSPDPIFRGHGLSAMSRAIAVVQRQIYMSAYINEKLGDQPPEGIVSISGAGMTEDKINRQFEQSRADRRDKGNIMYPGLMRLTSADPEKPVRIEFQSFRGAPDGFDWMGYTELDVKALALAIGDDPTELFPLSSQGLGTGKQSEIMHNKGKSRIFGDILTSLERMFNIAVLPVDMEMKFKSNDQQQSKEAAETARAWGFFASSVSEILPRKSTIQLLANTVDVVADIILDENGQVRLPDDDVVDDAQEVTISDDAVTQIADEMEVIAGDDAPAQKAMKAIQTTRLDFENAFEDLLADAVAGAINRRTFGVRARAMVSRGIRQAYLDGLEKGGVNRADLSEEDGKAIQRLQVQQSVYVTNLGAAIFKDEIVTPAEAVGKPAMWWNKSVEPAFYAGIESADRNGYYEWVLGRTEEHCGDCSRLNGQIHRMRDYIRTGWKPKASKLECKGFRCDCKLERRRGVRARGRFPSGSKAHEHVHIQARAA